MAENIEKWFSESPYEKGYDWILGVGDNGEEVNDEAFTDFQDIKHAVIFFGGLDGIEGLIEGDESVKYRPEEAHKLFHKYLDTYPGKGTATVRTEESILISLCKICPYLSKC